MDTMSGLIRMVLLGSAASSVLVAAVASVGSVWRGRRGAESVFGATAQLDQHSSEAVADAGQLVGE